MVQHTLPVLPSTVQELKNLEETNGYLDVKLTYYASVEIDYHYKQTCHWNSGPGKDGPPG